MKAYRYIDTLYASGDEDYGYTTYLKVLLREYEVIKETPKGIWIEDLHVNKKSVLVGQRFVNLNSHKKFACLTKEDASLSFIARKKRQVKILENQLKYAKEALNWFGVTVV
jgi:hypothetical protein